MLVGKVQHLKDYKYSSDQRFVLRQIKRKKRRMDNNQIYPAGGICSSCAGQSSGSCYCDSLADSAQNDTLPHFLEPVTKQKVPRQQLPKQKRTKRISNVDFKRFSAILCKIGKSCCNRSFLDDIQECYHRKDYFIRILCVLERRGCLSKAKELFNRKMDQISDQLPSHTDSDSEKTIDNTLVLVERHRQAFDQFVNRDGQDAIETSMKTVFNYEEMRQKPKFEKAVKEIIKMRKDMGLPF